MVKAYAVIGANYGDEGKGLVANALCRENVLQNRTVLNVLTNGGCQRGHTAYDKNGNRHVYSHFGSGYSYADMYFSKYYMVNPMIFFDEYNSLKNDFDTMNRIYIDEDCTITTPYDMLVNRMVENRRTQRHGSCGYGIWETVVRNEVKPLYWKDLLGKSQSEIVDIIRNLRDTYFTDLLNSYKIEMNQDEKELFYSENLIMMYSMDTISMQSITNVRSFESLEREYNVVVFENAQGLLLDTDIDDWGTPTKTGMAYIRELTSAPVTPYYVTRSYLTKHGEGVFPGECSKNDINPDMEDLTNHPNNYQGTLRYGKFTKELAEQLQERIKKDAEDYTYKVVVTHQNEFQCEYLDFADFYSDNEYDFK